MSDARWVKGATDEAIADHVAAAIAKDGPTELALPGGRTPVSIFEVLLRRALPWQQVRIVPTDDRIVAADHPASNVGMLNKMLGGTGARIQPLTTGMVLRPFDLVWLGMGEDGHVASIFPNNLDTIPTAPGVVGTRPDPLPADAPYERLTLTFDALTASREMIFVISGTSKLKVMETALTGESNLPVSRLLARRQSPLTIYWKEQ